MTIQELIAAGYFIEAFQRFGGVQTVVEAHCPTTKVRNIGVGDTFEEAMVDLNNLLGNH